MGSNEHLIAKWSPALLKKELLVNAADGAFRSPPLDTDDRLILQPTEPGTISYFCGPHQHMTETITVVAASAPS